MNPSEFLRKVWDYQQTRSCYFFLCTKQGDKWREHVFNRSYRGLERFFKLHPDNEYTIYFCPLPFREPSRRKELVLGSRLLWADLDESHPRKSPLIPQVAWSTSPKRYASLWILDTFHTAAEIELANKRMTYSSGADPAGWDLTQVLRIPGLRNLKYKKKPKSKLMWFKDNKYSIDRVPEASQTSTVPGVDKELLADLPRNIRRTLVSRTTEGKRSDVLWKLNNQMAESGVDENKRFALLKWCKWNKFSGRRDEDRQLWREVHKIGTTNGLDHDFKSEIFDITVNDPSYHKFSEIDAKKVEWLWHPYIPLSKVTILDGDPGVGKSWLTCALSSHISQAKKLPNQKFTRGGTVLMYAREDGADDTIKPRLEAVKANFENIIYVDGLIDLSSEEGLDVFIDGIEIHSPRLVIIDPLLTYMGGKIDMNKSNEVLTTLDALHAIASKFSCAILVVRHLTKSDKSKALYRGQGSISFVGTARSVLILGRDTDDPDIRIMCQIKNSVTRQGLPMAFSIGDQFKWRGVSTRPVHEILSTVDNINDDFVKALEWLRGRLTDELSSKNDIIRDAEASGFGKKLIIQASHAIERRVVRKAGTTYWKKANGSVSPS